MRTRFLEFERTNRAAHSREAASECSPTVQQGLKGLGIDLVLKGRGFKPRHCCGKIKSRL
jgi:hypothetical protein